MPFPVPPLPSSSSSRRSTKPTLLSLSSLSQPSYASGSTARLRSGQLGRTAGYEDVALLGRKVADRSKRRREQERKRKEAKGKGKAKVKMVVDSDEHDEEEEEEDDEEKEEDWNLDLDDEEREQSARRTQTGGDTSAAGGSRKRRSIKGKEKEKEVVSKRSRKTLKSIYVGDMDYLADPNPLYDSLPSSSLLTSLLHHTTSFYASHPSKVSTSNPTTPILTDAHPPTTTTPFISPSVALIDEKAHQPFSRNRQKRRSMWMELDGDSLIALGILMEEHILHLLTTSGYAPPSPSSQPPIHPSPSPSPSPSPPPAPATVSFSLPPPSTSTSTARLPSSPPPSSSGEDAPGASNGKRPRKNPKKPSYRRVGARPLSEVLKPKATERVETEKERKERERRKRVAPEAGSGWKEREEEAGFFGTVRRAKRVRVSRKVGGEKGEKEREEREERERERAEEKGSGEEREEFERRVLGLGQKKQGKKVVVDSP